MHRRDEGAEDGRYRPRTSGCYPKFSRPCPKCGGLMKLLRKVQPAECWDSSSPNHGVRTIGLRFWLCESDKCRKVVDAWDGYEPPEHMRGFFVYPSGMLLIGKVLVAAYLCYLAYYVLFLAK